MKTKNVKINSKSGKNKIAESKVIAAEHIANSITESIDEVRDVIDIVPVATKEQLRESIYDCIDLANKVMMDDRSTVLRLKNVVGKLKDALKVIK